VIGIAPNVTITISLDEISAIDVKKNAQRMAAPQAEALEVITGAAEAATEAVATDAEVAVATVVVEAAKEAAETAEEIHEAATAEAVAVATEVAETGAVVVEATEVVVTDAAVVEATVAVEAVKRPSRRFTRRRPQKRWRWLPRWW